MADYFDQVNMNDSELSANTVNVKEEQCQEDSFVEHKVYISETAVTTDNAELQGPIWHGKIKQYEDSTRMDTIKTELVSFKVVEVDNVNFKIEGGVSTDDVKTEIDHGQLYCEHCEAYYIDYCIGCGMLVHILNKYGFSNTDSGAPEDIPNNILEIQYCLGHTGIYALRIIPAGVIFGPFTGLGATDGPWEVKGEKFVLDKNKWKYLNWMQFVNPTRNISERNLYVYQCEDNIYYQSTRQIQAGDELLVYFGGEYCQNKIVIGDYVTTTKHIVEDIFACTFCCFGFSSKSYLAKHKTICLENTAGKFSFEELVQCPYCKIHLYSKEYVEYHMAFCCERGARKGILPTPAARQATAALNGRKRCLRRIYKCEQCKYTTKYEANLKRHTSNQHYRLKMCKCGICNRLFKTKESFRLHMENTHAFVEGSDDQKHSRTDYRNTHIKVEQSSSHNNKTDLRRHTKAKDLKQYDYKCDSCEYEANFKHNLEQHIKTKHLMQFDYKCDNCEFQTNGKHALKKHIKTKHLKQFDYNCDKCEYRTNEKCNLEQHIKTKHLIMFDYKCDKCEFGTNDKRTLEQHIKTKHLKEFDYKCDKCEFRTNEKHVLKKHIKTKHLKEFDYKCDKCEYKTNEKSNLEQHIKTKYLKELDYKCHKCEFAANNKSHLKKHIKTKHLMEFDFKCDSCEFRTNNKSDLKRHMKTKHLKEFDYKCDSCEFGTNSKYRLQSHIKTNHLKQFDYKCDKCEFQTNHKQSLKIHTKRKHLKE